MIVSYSESIYFGKEVVQFFVKLQATFFLSEEKVFKKKKPKNTHTNKGNIFLDNVRSSKCIAIQNSLFSNSFVKRK